VCKTLMKLTPAWLCEDYGVRRLNKRLHVL
jgi:hypothetical protein